MAGLGGKASITEFVFTIGDANGGRSGNAGKRNGVALNQLTWGNALLRRKAKAIGSGYGSSSGSSLPPGSSGSLSSPGVD